MRSAAVWMVAMCALGASLATAQVTVGPGVPPTTANGLTVVEEELAPVYFPGGAGTVFGSHARGMSEVIRAQGLANLLNSQAAINFDQARRSALETQRQYVNTYFALREMNQEYRARERGEKPTSQDLIRYAQMARPDRLDGSQLDPVTGELNWPVLLTAEGFAEGRAELERVFRERAAYGILNASQFAAATRTAEQMLASLQEQVRDLPPQQYIEARKFLDSVRYEAGLPVG
jgi:hypothetical protein